MFRFPSAKKEITMTEKTATLKLWKIGGERLMLSIENSDGYYKIAIAVDTIKEIRRSPANKDWIQILIESGKTTEDIFVNFEIACSALS